MPLFLADFGVCGSGVEFFRRLCDFTEMFSELLLVARVERNSRFGVAVIADVDAATEVRRVLILRVEVDGFVDVVSSDKTLAVRVVRRAGAGECAAKFSSVNVDFLRLRVFGTELTNLSFSSKSEGLSVSSTTWHIGIECSVLTLLASSSSLFFFSRFDFAFGFGSVSVDEGK